MSLPCCVSKNAEREAKYLAMFKPWNRPYFTTDPCPVELGCQCQWPSCYIRCDAQRTQLFDHVGYELSLSELRQSNSNRHLYERFFNGNAANEPDTRIPIRLLRMIGEKKKDSFSAELYFDCFLGDL